MAFDYAPYLRSDLPAPAERWRGFPPYNFVGGHNDADSLPLDQLVQAASDVLAREGRTLATYGLESGPQGHLGLRRFVAAKLKARARLACHVDDILITAGSLQALDLVNAAFLQPGDTVIVEATCYGGMLSRLQACGARYVGVDLDDRGIRTDHLASILRDLKGRGVRPKFLYTIPTVHNPTGTVMSEQRRLDLLALAADHDLLIFEDDCYADLLWTGERPPAIRALDTTGRVVYCGSFSKSIAPALRVGYLVADWPLLSRMLPLKNDGGGGALEQMILGQLTVPDFDAHVEKLQRALRKKCTTMVTALEEQFGSSAEFTPPKGGIFIWVTLPEAVDSSDLAAAALEQGVTLNPGAEWSADPASGRHRLRLCFAHPSKETIREGIKRLAEICHRQTGIPVRSGNVERSTI